MPTWLRRGPSRGPEQDAPPGASPAAADHPVPTRHDDQAGHALRAPSRLHAFNRYEIKYLVPTDDVPALRAELTARMDLDSHGGSTGYGVWSVYYDTDQLRFYWEKIEGLKFRRKLRVRHYGDRSTISDDTIVHVEIKQRVNRVTQKRRVALPYRLARDLCDHRLMVAHDPSQRAFLEEVLELLCGLDLRPVAMTGYQREAFVGRDSEMGLRVTLDHRVRGRDRDFHLGADAENRLIVPARLAVVEIKANERVPYWLTDLAARSNMSIVRMSKYCQSVEAFGRAPRSIFHVADDTADLATTRPKSEV
ncbi:VTC domain-containing protein [Micromonospora phaseoli]|uniref:VTC domain-containing protein n=1 Tax=Micromonospora phaseoli TaxID=1144548 RepID=A0A1H6YM50_9ACTN|nr:polyphosphate polymerase domain-containing protein [Micromonospora phaseoli]PZW00279.1 VTC domain-containing protein [Micromonospora phaseoli]GIJ76755.1 VTC domain-containing protein [Micromonospora phaseoli]SEJ42403.1 VTC domain-containing protein [Micromonospora phaseoli]